MPRAKITKHDTDILLHRIYRELRNTKDIKVVFDRSLSRRGKRLSDLGYVEIKNGKVILAIDPNPIAFCKWAGKNRNVISTILHECIHLIKWDVEDDREIVWLEKQMMRTLSDRQLLNLMQRVFSIGGKS